MATRFRERFAEHLTTDPELREEYDRLGPALQRSAS